MENVDVSIPRRAYPLTPDEVMERERERIAATPLSRYKAPSRAGTYAVAFTLTLVAVLPVLINNFVVLYAENAEFRYQVDRFKAEATYYAKYVRWWLKNGR